MYRRHRVLHVFQHVVSDDEVVTGGPLASQFFYRACSVGEPVFNRRARCRRVLPRQLDHARGWVERVHAVTEKRQPDGEPPGASACIQDAHASPSQIGYRFQQIAQRCLLPQPPSTLLEVPIIRIGIRVPNGGQNRA